MIWQSLFRLFSRPSASFTAAMTGFSLNNSINDFPFMGIPPYNGYHNSELFFPAKYDYKNHHNSYYHIKMEKPIFMPAFLPKNVLIALTVRKSSSTID
jgi:hypothetical protein